MATWTPILILYFNEHLGAIDHVDGFKTLAACQTASQQVRKEATEDVKVSCVMK
jgi:hypothetical protein